MHVYHVHIMQCIHVCHAAAHTRFHTFIEPPHVYHVYHVYHTSAFSMCMHTFIIT